MTTYYHEWSRTADKLKAAEAERDRLAAALSEIAEIAWMAIGASTDVQDEDLARIRGRAQAALRGEGAGEECTCGAGDARPGLHTEGCPKWLPF